MSQNEPTKDEHYIPQFYLKGFSPDNNRVYQYDLHNWKALPMIKTRKICVQKNLYEFTDNLGNIMNQNAIEGALSKIEGAFDTVLAGIVKKLMILVTTKPVHSLQIRKKHS